MERRSLVVVTALLVSVANIWLASRFVQTDMGNAGARSFGMEKAFVTVEDSVAGVVKEVSCAFARTDLMSSA